MHALMHLGSDEMVRWVPGACPVVRALAAVLCLGGVVRRGAAATPPADIAVADLAIPGPETTRIVEPVRDGFVDYLAAVNIQIGASRQPKENAFGMVSAIFGGKRRGFVGMATPDAWLRLPAGAVRPKPFVHHDYDEGETPKQRAAFQSRHDRAGAGPWKGADFAPVRDWLATNDEAMTAFAAVIRTTKLRIPAIDGRPEGPSLGLGNALLPAMGGLGHMADAFAVRAYGAMARGDLQSALHDVETILRFGAQFDEQFDLSARLTGGRIRTTGYGVLTTLVQSEHADAVIFAQAQRMLETVDPPVRPYLATVTTTYRWTILDLLQRRAFGDMLHLALMQSKDRKGLDKDKRAALNEQFRPLGWGYAMQNVNAIFDQIEATRTQPPEQAAAMLREIRRQIPTDPQVTQLQQLADMPQALLRLDARESGYAIARATLAYYLPDLGFFETLEARCRNARATVRQLVARRRAAADEAL